MCEYVGHAESTLPYEFTALQPPTDAATCSTVRMRYENYYKLLRERSAEALVPSSSAQLISRPRTSDNSI